jgi:hypothetical protein
MPLHVLYIQQTKSNPATHSHLHDALARLQVQRLVNAHDDRAVVVLANKPTPLVITRQPAAAARLPHVVAPHPAAATAHPYQAHQTQRHVVQHTRTCTMPLHVSSRQPAYAKLS